MYTRFTRTSLVLLFLTLISTFSFAQDETGSSELQSTLDGHNERIQTLEASVSKLSKLKISGYVQPQWVWQDIDSLGNQFSTRNYFQIRRGRIKFTHTTPIEGTSGSISAVIYPDIIETGVSIREVHATWNVFANSYTQLPELALKIGSMSRPFGYEIAYSSSAREVAERSTAENRLFNGERDLGLQVMYSPTIGSITPELEMGIFNGSDNFGKGPVSAVGGSSSQSFFSSSAVIGSTSSTMPAAGAADSAYIAGKINSQLAAQTTAYTTANAIQQNKKEFIGHLRIPFLVSDEFSFDVGGSWSIGGIAPISNIIAEYSGEKGALVLSKEGETPHTFNTSGYASSGLFHNNRTILGGDIQLYLSILPIGGTIIKSEIYTGTLPFYGTSALYSSADTAELGAPIGVLVKKNVMGMYAMLVQNITSNFQFVIRYDMWDPNTNFIGTDAASIPKINGYSYIKTNGNFGGDLATSTLTVAFNAFIGGSLRLMVNVDVPMLEEYTKKVGSETVTVGDPKDNRFTFRTQYIF